MRGPYQVIYALDNCEGSEGGVELAQDVTRQFQMSCELWSKLLVQSLFAL